MSLKLLIFKHFLFMCVIEILIISAVVVFDITNIPSLSEEQKHISKKTFGFKKRFARI